MNRYPFVLFLAIALAIGIFCAVKVSGIFLLVFICLLIGITSVILRNLFAVLAISLFLILGLFLGLVQSSLQANDPIRAYFEKEVVAEGLVVSDINKKNQFSYFDLNLTKISGKRAGSNIRVYSKFSKMSTGQYLRINGSLKSYTDASGNPRVNLFTYSRPKVTGRNIFWSAIGDSRSWIKRNLLERRSDAAAFIFAMLTGKTSELTEVAKADLKASGLAHLWAVSGLHTGFIVLLILMLFRLLRIKSGWQLIFLIIILFFFSAFTGFKPPVLRASIMASWLSAAYLLGRRRNWPAALSSAAIMSLTLNPASLFSASFQLSFAAVSSLFIFKEKIESIIDGVPSKLKGLLSVSISVQILTLPLIGYYFEQIPVFSVIVNIIAVPLAAIIFYFAVFALAAKSIGIGFVMAIPIFLSNIILKVSAFFNSFSFSTVSVPTSLIVLMIAGLGLVVFLMRRKQLTISFSTIALTTLLVIAIGQWLPFAQSAVIGNNLQVEFLDIGQGDATLITGPSGEKVLIDSGQKSYRIKEHLIKRKVNKLDLVVASHADADHIGGLSMVLRSFNVRAVLDNGYPKNSYYYKDFLSAIKEKNIRYILARRGDNLKIGTLAFKILNPPEGYISSSNSPDNDNSIVLKLGYKNTSFLFTGDAGFEAEDQLVKRQDLQSTVLKVAHHGSASSTSNEFLKYVRPTVGVISVGKTNTYGHPKPIVLNRLTNARAKIYRTDISSSIKMVVTEKGLQVYD